MATAATTICLVMIVRDEAAIITRALASVWPHVDEWCIVDTGSVDDTVDAIRAFVDAHPKPGGVHARPWRDFGANRTEALALARAGSSAHWLLMMDADDSLHCEGGTSIREALHGAAACKVRVIFGTEQTYRLHFFVREAAWAYKGRRHECPILPSGSGATEAALGTLPASVYIHARTEGARNRNPDKYRDDAAALEADASEHPEDTRCLFYTAQSWRDAREYDRALGLYKAVVAAGGWAEERYVACLNIVWMEPVLETALQYAWQAVDIQPARVEVAVAALERCRRASAAKAQLLAMGLYLARAQPSAMFLFVDPAAYEWKLADELVQLRLALGAGAALPAVSAVPVDAAPLAQRPRLKFYARVAASCPQTATALTFADCLAPGARVYMHPVRPLFLRPAELLTAWLSAAGCVVSTAAECSVQICFLDAVPLPAIPLIVVATEQPRSCLYDADLLRLYATAAWVWCMDNVDYAFLHAQGLCRLKIMPLMFGTYYMPAFVCTPASARTDVLQFGTKNARRDAVMGAIAALRPQARLLHVDHVYDERQLSALVLVTRVVVIPAYWLEPATYGLHRLAFLLHFPEVVVLVEDAPTSVYYRYILEVAGGHIRAVAYGDMARAAVAALDEEALPAPPSPRIAAFANKLLAWNGATPWVHLLL